MAFWIFKVAEQEMYPDIPGKLYVYDNTHSVRVVPGDVFIYLDKKNKYSFTATGIVKKLNKRAPSIKELSRTNKINTVFTAHLQDVIWLNKPLSIHPTTKQGKINRSRLGIVDANLLGWSQSIPSLNESMYQSIMDLAETEGLISPSVSCDDFSIPDKWGMTKTRCALKMFSDPVLQRSSSACIICGTALQGIVEAAHLSPYASDIKNRSNPANGVCLCKFCHRALDLRLIAIQSDGNLLVSPSIDDNIAIHHFSQISSEKRMLWLKGVDPSFLQLTVEWFLDNQSKK